MSVSVLAEVLLKMVTEDDFAREVINDPQQALAPYAANLTQEERTALSTVILPEHVQPIYKSPYVGAWRLLASNIDTLDPNLKQNLNKALAARSGGPINIPCTGT